MKKIFTVLLLVIYASGLYSQNSNKEIISDKLNQWHKDAATANGESYFALMTADAIYIGTDATEHWTKDQFYSFAKPYFDAGKAWDFKTIERNIYFSTDNKVAWFDELLNTWMGVCRGSGVLENIDGEWKLKHYHLSVTVPNEKVKEFIELTTNQ